jgi:hypothetical protein
MSDLSERVRVHSVEVLSDDWYVCAAATSNSTRFGSLTFKLNLRWRKTCSIHFPLPVL